MQPTIHLEGIYRVHIQLYVPNVLWVAFSIPPGSLSLVKYPVYREIQFPKDDSTTNFLNHTILHNIVSIGILFFFSLNSKFLLNAFDQNHLSSVIKISLKIYCFRGKCSG
jgi:hypothetical protein